MTSALVLPGILAATLILMLTLTLQQRGVSQGMYRSYYLLGGAACLGIAAVPNLWLQALLMLMLVNLLRDPLVGVHLSRAVPLYLLTVCGALLVPYAIPVHALLLMMSCAGLLLTLQVGINLSQQWGNNNIVLHAGQENVNNTQAISVLCTSAAVGLAWGYDSWWWVTVPIVALPILLIQWFDWRFQRTVTMGPVILAGLALSFLPFAVGFWSLLAVLPLVVGLVWSIGQAFRRPIWWDSGRIRVWWMMLVTGWWAAGWSIRLWGRGWQSWVGYHDFLVDVAVKTNRQAVMNTKTLLSTAHNEFVQMLFEHGAVALILLVGYVTTTLWRLGHGSPEAQAVYVVAVAWCGVACTLHPVTWTHGSITEVDDTETPKKGGGGMMMYTIGNPALIWLSFLIVLMVETVR